MNIGNLSLVGAAVLVGLLSLGAASSSKAPVAEHEPIVLGQPLVHNPLPARPITSRRVVGFGAALDLGELVDYPSDRVVRQEGPYTWHLADISEAHALNALATGNMRVSTPAGQVLDFAYERHAEHADGSWTFVARKRGGEAADTMVVTFGGQAAFGTIAQGRGLAPLRLSMRDGRSWLVETDTRALGRVDNPSTRPKVPDYRVPDYTGLPALLPTRHVMSASQASSESTGPQIIDLAVGYTQGYTNATGGTSQVLTRINNLVESTNQAYIDSQINARVRLVKALEVDYTDRNDNQQALNDVTAVYGDAPVSLAPLRQAREDFGADLVVLLRKFEPLEQQTCGIGWLLGGDLQPITEHTARYGYSVVSDGKGVDGQGNPSYCREDTFAHELGHNLGAHHDIATATYGDTVSYGAFEYSFGQKTDETTGNFYTIMSYYNSGQAGYAVYSNPRITFCGGLACGTENKADNARGIGQTASLIGAFRTTVVPVAPTPPESPTNGMTLSDCGPRLVGSI